jgi:hypothetical protein
MEGPWPLTNAALGAGAGVTNEDVDEEIENAIDSRRENRVITRVLRSALWRFINE